MTRWMMLNGVYLKYHTRPESLHVTKDGKFIDSKGKVYTKITVPQSVRYNITVYVTDDEVAIPDRFGDTHRLS